MSTERLGPGELQQCTKYVPTYAVDCCCVKRISESIALSCRAVHRIGGAANTHLQRRLAAAMHSKTFSCLHTAVCDTLTWAGCRKTPERVPAVPPAPPQPSTDCSRPGRQKQWRNVSSQQSLASIVGHPPLVAQHTWASWQGTPSSKAAVVAASEQEVQVRPHRSVYWPLLLPLSLRFICLCRHLTAAWTLQYSLQLYISRSSAWLTRWKEALSPKLTCETC